MTVLLDIATVAALLVVFALVPVLWLRAEAKITRQLRAAEEARAAEARDADAAEPPEPKPKPKRPPFVAGPGRRRALRGRRSGLAVTAAGTCRTPACASGTSRWRAGLGA